MIDDIVLRLWNKAVDEERLTDARESAVDAMTAARLEPDPELRKQWVIMAATWQRMVERLEALKKAHPGEKSN